MDDKFPLQYEEGPDYCTVRDAQCRDFALTVQPNILKAMERALEEVERLRDLISRPYIGTWTDEIIVEAAHQRDRWGANHDHGKAPEDWFWLIGYLAGKCLAAHRAGDAAKAHHHTVSTAAVLAHWAAAIDGNEGVFRPGLGIEKIAEVADHLPAVPQTAKVPQNSADLAERLIQAAVDYESGRCSKREMAEARTAVEAAIQAAPVTDWEDVEQRSNLGTWCESCQTTHWSGQCDPDLDQQRGL